MFVCQRSTHKGDQDKARYVQSVFAYLLRDHISHHYGSLWVKPFIRELMFYLLQGFKQGGA